MPADRPRLSVVLPVYNGRAEIAACLGALESDGFPRRDAEVIVVDDASTDGTAGAVAASFPWVHLLQLESNVGSFAARNCGVEAARGDVVAFLDADCSPLQGWADAVLAAVSERTPIVMGRVIPDPEFVQRTLAILEFGEFLEPRPRTLTNLATLNVAFEGRLIRAHGFDAGLRRGGDRDLAWRLVRDGHSIVFNPSQTVVHRPPADLASVLRRRKAYARTFRNLRGRHPDLPGGRLLSFGPVAVPLVALGRLALDLGRLVRSRAAIGVHALALPAYGAVLALARLLDLWLLVSTSRSAGGRSPDEPSRSSSR